MIWTLASYSPTSLTWRVRSPTVFASSGRRATRARRRLAAIATEHDLPIGSEVRVEVGDPATELIALAEAEDAELIVVASRGLGVAKAALLGGVSSALMRESPCPVVVVPPKAVRPRDAKRLDAVVCGVEGQGGDSRVLSFAADLAHRLGVDLHAVHAYDPRALHTAAAAAPAPPLAAELHEFAERRLERAVEAAGVRAVTHVLALPPDAALERVAESTRAGVIVVGSQGRGRLGSVLHGSVAIRLAAEGDTALVALPTEAELKAGSGHYELAAGGDERSL